jgi:uncharacterized protein (TIGR02246 family)
MIDRQDRRVASAFRRKRVVLALAVLALGGTAYAQSGDTAGVTKTRAAFEKAAAAQDPAAIAKLFATDAVEMPPNAPSAKGRAAIEAYHKGFAQQFMVHGFSLTPTETKVIGDTAYDVGTYKQSLMLMKGGGMMDDKGKYLVLLKKDASGTWLITHAIYNSDNPPPGSAPAKK